MSGFTTAAAAAYVNWAASGVDCPGQTTETTWKDVIKPTASVLALCWCICLCIQHMHAIQNL